MCPRSDEWRLETVTSAAARDAADSVETMEGVWFGIRARDDKS